jgi:hypothetical protein
LQAKFGTLKVRACRRNRFDIKHLDDRENRFGERFRPAGLRVAGLCRRENAGLMKRRREKQIDRQQDARADNEAQQYHGDDISELASVSWYHNSS